MIGIPNYHQDLLSNSGRLENLCADIVDKCMSSGAIYAQDGHKITSEEIEQIKAVFKHSMKSDLKDIETVEQAREMIVKAYSHLIASHQHSINAEKLKQEAEQHRINAERLEESSQKKLALAENKFAQAEKERQDALTRQFWSIFNAKDSLCQEKYSEVFSTYLSDRSLTIEKTSQGACFARINSMNSVIKYLTKNPLTKMCDFRHFKAEVNDVETLVHFLKTPAAFAIKGVAFKSAIPEVAKAKLAEAVTARANANAPLKVQYFA